MIPTQPPPPVRSPQELHLVRLKACRDQEARLRQSFPTTGVPDPSRDLAIWQVAGRTGLGRDWRSYAALRASELRQGYADPLARYQEALPPKDAL